MRLQSSLPALQELAQHKEVRLSMQAKMLAKQVQRSPLAVLTVALVLVYAIANHTEAWRIYVWLGLVAAGLFARFVYATSVMRRMSVEQNSLADVSQLPPVPPQAARVLRNLTWFAFFNGIAIGISAPLFFPDLPNADRAMVCLVLVGISAGGISTSAAYPPAFVAYILPALLPAVFCLAFFGSGQGPLSLLIVLFIVILFSFVYENHKLLGESFSIRFDHEKLVRELESKQEELLRAKEHAEQAKERAEEAGQAKARVLAAASHDLRQPLHALSLYSAVLSQQPEPQTLKEVSQQIDLSVRALNALLNALLDISRLDAGVYQIEQTAFNLHEVLQRIVHEFEAVAKRKGLGLLLDSRPVMTYTDPVVMERIVRNLIDNALKYTERGAVLVSTTVDDEHVTIAVRDTGKGIPPSEQNRVFEEFYQLDNPSRDREMGLGLGLSIVKRLAELVKSRIVLTSVLGEGSCFSWHVPLDRRSAPPIAGDGFDDGRVFCMHKRLEILVIEDEAAIRHGMGLLLGVWGMTAYGCAELQAAQEIMQQHDIDFIIADLRLEGGADGLEVVNTLRKNYKAVPVLLISGETDPRKLKDVAASGFALMNKPIQPEMLRKNIAQMLEKSDE